VHDIVKDNEPSIGILARLREEAEVGAHRIGRRVIPDRTVLVHLQLRRGKGARETVEQATRVIGTILRLRRDGYQQQQR
jgi:hypothetical protein